MIWSLGFFLSFWAGLRFDWLCFTMYGLGVLLVGIVWIWIQTATWPNTPWLWVLFLLDAGLHLIQLLFGLLGMAAMVFQRFLNHQPDRDLWKKTATVAGGMTVLVLVLTLLLSMVMLVTESAVDGHGRPIHTPANDMAYALADGLKDYWQCCDLQPGTAGFTLDCLPTLFDSTTTSIQA